ncbi:MAG: hypothetical protein ACI865_002434 [Flavobacteriaceae bacterium]|jgi:hypothetical protein
MKKITSVLLLCATALIFTNCGGPDADTSPFVGKIEFKGKAMGMESGGSMTIDVENQKLTYRIDALKDFMGIDVVVMVDMKKMESYSISPDNKVYMKMPIERKDMSNELPSKKEVEEMRKEFFSKLKATGKEKTIAGYTCEEYEVIEKVESLESAKIWVSKSMLNRIAPMWDAFNEIEKLDIDDMLIGFPMMAEGKAEGKSFSFEVTKITEGESALSDFDLKKYKEVSKMEFMTAMMKDSPMGDMMNSFKELEGLEESMEGLEGLVDDAKALEDLMERFN